MWRSFVFCARYCARFTLNGAEFKFTSLFFSPFTPRVMHLSMVCPRMGGAGNPREFDFVKLYPGRDFDIHNGPLGGWKI